MLDALLISAAFAGELPQVLVFTRTEGFRHASVDPGSDAIAEIGSGRWETTRTEDPTEFTPGNLSEYDALVFLNTTMDVLDDRQQAAFEEWLRGGGGWLGVHAAADTEYDWPFYGSALLGGAWFKTHPQVQEARVKVEDVHHPSMAGMPLDWVRTDEWYDYRANPRGKVHVLASLDEASYTARAPMGDHPIIWTTSVGKGNSLYTGGGHTNEAFQEPLFRDHLRQSIEFLLAGGWIDLVGDTLAGWHPPGTWQNVGGVTLDPVDPRRMISTPGHGVLFNGPEGRTSDLVSSDVFGDCEIHAEWMMAQGSNSGIYVQGRYEVQVLDSWGVETAQHHDAGGIYQRWDPARGAGNEGFEGKPPRVNAARKPGRWQSFDIVFRAARYDDAGRKIENARFERVVHNGILVHKDVELTGPTRGGWNESPGPAPIRLQGDHGPVAWRNIRVRRLGP
ncbi:MAG: ThuA domain-containing protein [Phycisphaerales bacterium]|nr:ThuA domain-containing protein [Phycisphaerales bacterium]